MKLQLLLLLKFIFSLGALCSALPVAPHVENRADVSNNGTRRAAGSRYYRQRNPGIKYFREPGRDATLNHYDNRFFKGIVNYDERTHTLQNMVRAYLKFFRQNTLETWIAHGTLLGWWWNGKMLPWDCDLDTQVSISTLAYLAENLNGTEYTYESDDATFQRKYLLDVNPWHRERDRGDGQNVIDARWIDTHNGLYIDITALGETHPKDLPGIWMCKNYHQYDIRDLYPLRDSEYEGVPVKVPYSYDKILLREYEAKALVVTEFHDHRWDPSIKEWVRMDGIKSPEPLPAPYPHIPESLRPPSFKPGITNIMRLMGIAC